MLKIGIGIVIIVTVTYVDIDFQDNHEGRNINSNYAMYSAIVTS